MLSITNWRIKTFIKIRWLTIKGNIDFASKVWASSVTSLAVAIINNGFFFTVSGDAYTLLGEIDFSFYNESTNFNKNFHSPMHKEIV